MMVDQPFIIDPKVVCQHGKFLLLYTNNCMVDAIKGCKNFGSILHKQPNNKQDTFCSRLEPLYNNKNNYIHENLIREKLV